MITDASTKHLAKSWRISQVRHSGNQCVGRPYQSVGYRCCSLHTPREIPTTPTRPYPEDNDTRLSPCPLPCMTNLLYELPHCRAITRPRGNKPSSSLTRRNRPHPI